MDRSAGWALVRGSAIDKRPPCLRLSKISSNLEYGRFSRASSGSLLRLEHFMSKRFWVGVALFLAFSSGATRAADLKDMIGKWRWQQFTIEVAACQGDSICAKVLQGPKNVGMEIFATKLTAKDGKLLGQIAHPETKDVYNTRFQQDDVDKWSLDGCTATRVCLSGEFVRVK